MESSFWDRGLILGGWAIAGLFALAALISVFRGDGGEAGPRPLVVARAEPREAAVSSVEGAAQPPRRTPSRPAPATQTPGTASTPALVLSGCDVLRTSPNWSPADREWFLTNCLSGGPALTTAPSLPPPAGGYDSGGAADEATSSIPTAAPQLLGDEDAAIALAIRWLGHDAPVAFNAEPASCSATLFGRQWAITCHATLAGCAESGACRRTVSVCVYLEPPTVAPQSC